MCHPKFKIHLILPHHNLPFIHFQVTLGTGSFLNLNTGPDCQASVHGLYPLVAWDFSQISGGPREIIYCMEGASNDTGSIIQWALNLGDRNLLNVNRYAK